MSNNTKEASQDISRLRQQLKTAKNQPNKVTPGTVRSTQLITEKALGASTVVQVISPSGMSQLVICRPIGITDLDAKNDWVILNGSHIHATLNRSKDPNEAQLKRARAMRKTTLAISEGLLVQKQVGDQTIYYYPHKMDISRTELRKKAEALSKVTKLEIREKIQKSSNKAEAVKLKNQLESASILLSFYDNRDREAELELRKFWNSAMVKGEVQKISSTYRTRTGQYGNIDQRAIRGANGLSLQNVTDLLILKLAGLDISAKAKRYTITGISQEESKEIKIENKKKSKIKKIFGSNTSKSNTKVVDKDGKATVDKDQQ